MNDDVRRRLDDLNRQIQVQRNVEMHAAMERARLETQRVELMSQMLSSSVVPAASVSPVAPYRVILQTPTPVPDNAAALWPSPNQPAHPVDARRRHKPPNLPSVATMITAVLKETPGLRPPEIADLIRKRWWPEIADPHNQHNGVADAAFGTLDAAGRPLRAQRNQPPPERLRPRRVCRGRRMN
jgi:hypothetical protein